MTIGAITLNLSLFFYFTTHLPQLLHNRRGGEILGLSLSFHGLLLLSYLTDLIYGFALGMPWQYKLVTGTGLGYLAIQQQQLYLAHKKRWLSLHALLAAIMLCVGVIYMPLPKPIYLAIGSITQVSAWLYVLPQVIKNHRANAALSLSGSYLLLHAAAMSLDTISAWSLHWPLPSQIGATFNLLLALVLLGQWAFQANRLKNSGFSELK